MLTTHKEHAQITGKYGIKMYWEREVWKNIRTLTTSQAKFNLVHYLSSHSH